MASEAEKEIIADQERHSYEALEAYENWLDKTEERNHPARKHLEVREAALAAASRPPWCPGGGSTTPILTR